MSLSKNIKSNLCISCGACEYLTGKKVSLKYDKRKGICIPSPISALSDNEIRRIDSICPANGYPIVALGAQIHQPDKYDYRIGYYHSFFAAKSRSKTILKKASSGGIMTSLAAFLLESKKVDGIIATKYSYDGEAIVPKSVIATSLEELLECQGSKYMPVPVFGILDSIKHFNGNLAFIGTPCQIAALRRLQRLYPEFQNIKFTIGNFCGGFRDLRELGRLRAIAGLAHAPIKHFQYRGDGQPGQMVIESDRKRWTYPYPDYARLTGYTKYYRCRNCVDATAELADASCGDAWLPRFINDSDDAWSMIIVRNPHLEAIFQSMKDADRIDCETVSLEELIKSQRQNIESKKERFVSRAAFLKLLGKRMPEYGGGYNPSRTVGILFEAKVWLSQLYKSFLERVGLYSFLIHKL